MSNEPQVVWRRSYRYSVLVESVIRPGAMFWIDGDGWYSGTGQVSEDLAVRASLDNFAQTYPHVQPVIVVSQTVNDMGEQPYVVQTEE